MTSKPDKEYAAAEATLQSYIERLDPEIQKLARSVRVAVQKRLPTANELVYDYKTFVVISYSPTDRGIDGIVSIAARPDGVRLYLNPGPQLLDPKKLMQGKGKQARFLRVESADLLADPDVKDLVDAAIDQAEIPLPSRRQGRLILRT